MTSIDNKALAAQVLVALAHAQEDGHVLRLDELAAEVDAFKADVRAVVTRLHAEGHVDALRLRVSLSGLALAHALEGEMLEALRVSARSQKLRRVA